MGPDSCVIDSEAIAVDENGLSVFDLIRYRRQDHAVSLCADWIHEIKHDGFRILAHSHGRSVPAHTQRL
jgi:ATP-dependent DNA ligase